MASKAKPAQVHEQKAVSEGNYLAAVIAGSVVIVLITLYVGSQLVGSIILNAKVLNKKNQANAALETKLKNAPILVENYKKLGSDKTLVADALPTSEDFPQVVALMDNLAASSGVTLKSVGLNPAQSSGPVAPTAGGAIPPSFTVGHAGRWSQRTSFFKNL